VRALIQRVTIAFSWFFFGSALAEPSSARPLFPVSSQTDSSQSCIVDSLVILSSASMRGRVAFAAGIHREESGGVGRRAAFYAQIRSENENTLTLDAGDFLRPDSSNPSLNYSPVMVAVLNGLGYDAWTPGENELFFGADNLKYLAREIHAEVVSANIADSSGVLLFPDRLVRQLGSIRVGITGVTSPGAFTAFFPSNWSAADPGLRIHDVCESLEPVIAALTAEVDIIVVLAHMGPGECTDLARMFPEIHVIVVGHSSCDNEPFQTGDVFLMCGGRWGEYGTYLKLGIDDYGSVRTFKGESKRLPLSAAVDTTFEAKMVELQIAHGDTSWARIFSQVMGLRCEL
jgi:2',3'-cyclic-nucleotide 2'-phosphodiesterase (5'-nucleotidase family)